MPWMIIFYKFCAYNMFALLIPIPMIKSSLFVYITVLTPIYQLFNTTFEVPFAHLITLLGGNVRLLASI